MQKKKVLKIAIITKVKESGIAPVVVQRLIGHKDITITLNTYTSMLNKFKEEELQKLNNYYDNKHLSNFSASEHQEK